MKPYYSKKVLEHFLHPKNFGKIKDASGIGDTQNMRCGDVMKMYIKVKKLGAKEVIENVKFETFGCLPPSEKTLIHGGDWEDISLIKKGMSVLNGEGRKTRVARTFKRKYAGPMLTMVPLVSPFNRFSVTPEHPILCVKRNQLKSARRYNKKCKWLKIEEGELLTTKPDFAFARELIRGDYLVYVPNKTVKDNSRFTPKIMKLLGYYLSEGYITANKSALNFSLNKNEKDNIAELKKLLFDVLKKEPKERIRRNVAEIYICSRQWCRFFKEICRTHATQKRLSEEILDLPFKKQWEMIKTYIKGDGSSSVRRPGNYPRYEITTASLSLAVQIQEILARGGIFSSIRKRKFDESRNHIEGREVFSNPVYDVFFKTKRKHKFVHFANQYFLVPIKNILRRKYEGYVHNFLVMGSPNSYLVKGFAVHNCGHAISISDIMCELIKGKTIKQALKIDYNDVVKELGSVPPAKIHCSYLAKSALKAAIDDYREKIKK